ncbi:TPA: hypothetical protein ACHG9O_002565, partial [Staphylococcus aureus]
MTAFYYALHYLGCTLCIPSYISLSLKSSLSLLFYFATLVIKKETLRSQLAWQRSTLAERKF